MCDVGCLFRCCDEPQKFQEKMLISVSIILCNILFIFKLFSLSPGSGLIDGEWSHHVQ